jgi:hypothetical protein
VILAALEVPDTGIDMKKRTLSKVVRSEIDDCSIHGVIVQESESLLMLHREIDFAFDGFVVLSKRYVSEKTTGTARQDRYAKIMHAEGLWKSISRSMKLLPISNWMVFFNAITGMPVLIENESESESWIGVVVSCSKSVVQLRCFDSLGVLDEELTRIPIRVITLTQFGDRYTKLQYKFIRKEKQKGDASH